jgi:hypothetical protein
VEPRFPIREVRLSCNRLREPAAPRHFSGCQESKPFLQEFGVAEQLRLQILFEQERQDSTILHYIDRCWARDVWGNDKFVVKLSQHEEHNADQARDLLKLAARLPNQVDRVVWIGLATFTNPENAEYRLSCLIVEAQGAGLWLRMRDIAARTTMQPEAKCRLLLNMYLAVTEFFVQAWRLDCFLDGYDLGQVCVKRHVGPDAPIKAADLVLVDVTAIGHQSDCREGYITQIWRPFQVQMRRLLGQVNVHLATRSVDRLLEPMTKHDLEVHPESIIMKMQRASDRLIERVARPPVGMLLAATPALPVTDADRKPIPTRAAPGFADVAGLSRRPSPLPVRQSISISDRGSVEHQGAAPTSCHSTTPRGPPQGAPPAEGQ